MTQGANWEKFRDKKVGLLGAGKENISLIPYLIKAGAEVTICEQRSDQEAITNLEKISDIQLRIGEDSLSELGDFDYIFRTPGMPVSVVDKSLVGQTKQPVRTSAVDLFFEFFGDQTIGVTGTKGKGTTSTMINSILNSDGHKVILAGNIGNSIFDSLDELTSDTKIVMELSSFQLEDVSHSPKYAVILPVTEEHLQPLSERSPNYHRSLEDYVEAKRQIVAFQTAEDFVVYSADNPSSTKIAESSKAGRVGVGEKNGDAVVDEGVLSFKESKIDLVSTGIKGDHLIIDAALAATVAKIIGVKDESIIKGLKNFKPLPHRMEKIGEFSHITVFDDSYATAPDATIAALSAFDQPIILLAGGSRKGADFSELAAEIVKRKVKAVVLIGQESGRIAESLKNVEFSGLVDAQPDLESAVKKLKEAALPGDVVLLSPACASKDMFKDAADRGAQFSELIRRYFSV